ncbi:hypothetical protein MHU86_7175 [Fragilaria crotonensis]|nr:hypothetical protein MHU86_7175 [Fragilaria crotonensis]
MTTTILKRRIKELTDGELPPTAPKSIVLLNEPGWRDNDGFDHLIRQHLVQYHHLGIEKLASSIVRHWIGNQGGCFVETDPSGDVHILTHEPDIAIKVGVLLQSVVRLSAATTSPQTQRITSHSYALQSQDATNASLSPLDNSLQDHINDEETKPFDQNVLLPTIPQDIFDQPMQELSHHSSPRRSQDSHPKVSLNVKPLKRTAERMDGLQQSHVSTITSPANKAISNGDENDLLTPKINNTTDSKQPAIRSSQALNESENRPTHDPKLLPATKRRKKCVAFDRDTMPPRNNSHYSKSEMEPTPFPPSSGHTCDIHSYTTNDVLFAGKWARNHKGNMLLNEWTARFCKRLNAQSDRKEIAKQIVTLFKTLAGRFLEAKRSSLEGQSSWDDIEDSVAIERTSVLIQKMVIDKKLGNPTSLDASRGDGTIDLKRPQKVKILKMDLKSHQICLGNDMINLESTDNDQLWINDVMLGPQDGRETHYGNLKFFHHIDDYAPKFERSTTVGGRLNVIRLIISSWKKHVAKDSRFVVRNGDVYSIVGADDELTVFLGVAEMIKEIIRPIPAGSHDIHLGDKWTIQRTNLRNREYYKLIASNMSAFSGVSTSQSLILEELNIAGDVIRKACWKSYPTSPFQGGFKAFDTTLQDWVLLSVEEAVKRTLVLLRLKSHFSGNPAKTDNRAAFSQSDPAHHSKALLAISAGSEQECKQNNIIPPRRQRLSKRSGATRPVPNPVKASRLASPKGGTNLASLLQSEIWSPIESPEEVENCRPTTPVSPIPTKLLVTDVSTTRAVGMTSLMHPVARHFTTQPGLVPEGNFRQLHTWTPVACDSNTISKSPQICSERLFHPLLHGRFMTQHPNSSAFWPPHASSNCLNHPALRNPDHASRAFIVPNPEHSLAWLPYSVPTDGGTPDST